jgi:hypothetical protein
MAWIMYGNLAHAVTMKMTTIRGMTRAVEEIAVRKGKIADTMMLTW